MLSISVSGQVCHCCVSPSGQVTFYWVTNHYYVKCVTISLRSCHSQVVCHSRVMCLTVRSCVSPGHVCHQVMCHRDCTIESKSELRY